MRVSRAQATENRARVVAVASRLLRERGIDGVGVDALMQGAGLTHGGFYKSFASKDALVAEACERALADTAARWEAVTAASPRDPLGAWLGRYLSREHCEGLGGGCAFAALGAEAARRDGPVRRVFGVGLRAAVERMGRIVPGRSAAQRRERALATMASLVGAMVLARAVDDPTLRDEILSATAKVLASRPDDEIAALPVS